MTVQKNVVWPGREFKRKKETRLFFLKYGAPLTAVGFRLICQLIIGPFNIAAVKENMTNHHLKKVPLSSAVRRPAARAGAARNDADADFRKAVHRDRIQLRLPQPSPGRGRAADRRYASLQNWDGLFRFSRALHSAFVVKQQPLDVFEAANDPLAQLSERLAELKQSGTLPLLVRRTSVIIRLHGAAGCIVTALSALESTP